MSLFSAASTSTLFVILGQKYVGQRSILAFLFEFHLGLLKNSLKLVVEPRARAEGRNTTLHNIQYYQTKNTIPLAFTLNLELVIN